MGRDLQPLLGLYHVAAVPFGYALIVLASIVLFILVERFNLLAYTQLSLLLLLRSWCSGSSAGSCQPAA